MGFNYSVTRQAVQLISLNDLLDQLEVDVSRVGQGNFENAQNLLVKMDEAQQRIDSMLEKNLPVKAESAQFDYLVSDLEKNAKKALNDLGGAGQLNILRQQSPLGSKYPWWYLDEIYTRQRKKTISKVLMATGSAGLFLVIFIAVYNTFLKPDPAVVGKYEHQMNAEQMIAQGDFTNALSEINLALGFAPSDAGLLILRGVIQTKIGNIDQGNSDFRTAESLLGNHINFLVLRSQSWLTLGDFESSLKDSQLALREDPMSAEGYFYFARANEFLLNYTAAIDAYQTASELAESQGKAELNATIRISLAMLMQSLPGLLPTDQLTPTR